MHKEIGIDAIVAALTIDHEIIGPTDTVATHPARIDEANETSITFCNLRGASALSAIFSSKGGVVFCHEGVDIARDEIGDKTIIRVANPRFAFIEILNAFFADKREHRVAESAVIHENAQIHPSVSIGDFCYIEACSIGEGSVIYEDVKIYAPTRIGKNVTIHAGTTIGVPDAFSYERNAKGELIKFHHFGGVVIEDDVELHQHVNIDRATFGNTIIGKGTKINRYTHIGHNSVIGRHCQIGGKCFIAGSCVVGDFCEIAFCSCLRDVTTLGENVMVGMGAVVTADVESNWMVYGVPAKKAKQRPPHSYPLE